MSVVHPVQEIGEQLEKAFYAIENPQLAAQTPDIRNASVAHTWFPNLEITEVEGEYIVRIALAGLDPDEVDVTVENRLLILKSGKLSRYAQELRPRFGHEREIYEKETDEANIPIESLEDYGECVYQMPLPATIDADNVNVGFVEDVLEIYLPKIKESPSSSMGPVERLVEECEEEKTQESS